MKINRIIRQVHIEYQMPGGVQVLANVLIQVLADNGDVITESAREESYLDRELALAALANGKNTWDEAEILSSLRAQYSNDEVSLFTPVEIKNDEDGS